MSMTQPPPPLPGFEPVQNVHELPQSQTRPQRRAKAAEERPQPQDDVTTVLVDVIEKALQVTKARIAYHEAELRRLRAALKPFAEITPTPAEPLAAEDALAELLQIVKKLPADPGVVT